MHGRRDKVHASAVFYAYLRYISRCRKPSVSACSFPSLTPQNRPEKSRTRSSHPPLVLLTGWTTSPLSFPRTRETPTIGWKPLSSLPTSTENARNQQQVSLHLVVRTHLALSFVGHRVQWSTISQNLGESHLILYTQCCSKTRGRVRTPTTQSAGLSSDSVEPNLHRT